MNLFQWLGQSIGLGTRFTKFWATYFGASAGGEVITTSRAMTISAVMQGTRLYGTTVGTLPINVFRNLPNGESEIVRDDANPYDLVLRVSPNEDVTTTEFWEAMVGATLLTGNGYARKQRVGSRLVGLEIVTASPYRKPDFALWYRGTDQFGRQFDLPHSEMFHLKGFSLGGDEGLSIVQFGALSLGTTLSGLKTSAKIMQSGLGTAGFLETQQVLEEPDRDRLQQIMNKFVTSENPAKVMMLEGGMKFNRMSVSAADAQLLDQIKFGVEEVARWLGIPPILLGHSSDGQTMWGTGTEAIVGTWYTLGLRAFLTRIEKAIHKRVIEPADRSRFFVKFNVDALLRGDSQAQAILFAAAAQNGWMTRNEIRKLLDLPPLPGGDDLTVQVNLTLLQDLRSQNQQTANQARAALLNWLTELEGQKANNQKAA